MSIPSSEVRERFFISLIATDLSPCNFTFFPLFLGFKDFGSSIDVSLPAIILAFIMFGVAGGLTAVFASDFLDLDILGVFLVLAPTPRMFSTTCCQYRSMAVRIATGLEAEKYHIN